jgi:hypothetical protein
MWDASRYACGVPWWQRCEFDIDKESYSRMSQVEFGPTGPYEKWTNNVCGLIWDSKEVIGNL